MTLLKDLTELTSAEAEYYGRLLEKKRVKLETSLREKIREKLIIQKSKEAGITVSEEEIKVELAKKKIEDRLSTLNFGGRVAFWQISIGKCHP
jgi:hypothetical protein